MKRLSIDISSELHHYLKIQTARTRDTLVNYVKEAIYSRVEKEKIPNAETLKALEDSRNGIGINEYASWEEMIAKIEKKTVETTHAEH